MFNFKQDLTDYIGQQGNTAIGGVGSMGASPGSSVNPSFASDIQTYKSEGDTSPIVAKTVEYNKVVDNTNKKIAEQKAQAQQGENKPYDPTGKTVAQVMAETGRQSELDKMGSTTNLVKDVQYAKYQPAPVKTGRVVLKQTPTGKNKVKVTIEKPLDGKTTISAAQAETESVAKEIPKEVVKETPQKQNVLQDFLGKLGIKPKQTEVNPVSTGSAQIDKTVKQVRQTTPEQSEMQDVPPVMKEFKQEVIQDKPVQKEYVLSKDDVEKIQNLNEDAQEKMIELVQKGNEALADTPYEPYIFEGYRTPERQAELYAQGRTKPGAIVTNAAPGESRHNSGNAVDIYFRNKETGELLSPNEAQKIGLYKRMGAVGKSLGLTHGGTDWGWDDPHFEL